MIVGRFMLAPIARIDFSDYSESIPSFPVLSLMAFRFHIAIGIRTGFVPYAPCKIAASKVPELKPGLWVFTAPSRLFFVSYPYS